MGRILVIEDNRDNLELMVYLLGAFGHSTSSALDGEAGVESARREQPDLILCDIQMPRLDGFGVARRLNSELQLQDIPLIAVTALAMVGDREKVLARGFDGYIVKPIAPETFVSQVEAFLNPALRSPAPPVSRHSESAPARTVDATSTVLAVDNTPVNLELLRSILEPFGYRVLAAGNVADALVLAGAHTPDLIVSDVHMPGTDGFAFIEAVKADPELRLVPFIFLSSTVAGDFDRVRALTLGAKKFIMRPIDPESLLQQISESLKNEDSSLRRTTL